MREADQAAAAVGMGQPGRGRTRVRVRVPATTANLGPGFDTLGMALSLYNYFEVEPCASGCHVEADGEAMARVPQGADNLVIRAAQAVWERTGLPPTGWRVRLRAEIPLGCGLGSSASAIVGGVVAANALAGEPLSTGELLAIAAELEGHADNVTPAMVGGFTVAAVSAHGAQARPRVHWVRFPAEGLRAVVAIPNVELPTQHSRRILPRQVGFEDAVFNVSRACLLVAGLTAGDACALAAAMDDRLHQPYRAALVPGFHAVVQAAREAGALGAVLSGAGPAVLALVAADQPVGRVGEAMTGAFSAAGVSARWLALTPDQHGAVVEAPVDEDQQGDDGRL